MAWIGGLKAFQYEADGIVPFVANSPLMNFFYTKDAPEYVQYKNPEGKTVQKNIDWHKQNGTYLFSYGLGTVILLIGLAVLLGIWNHKIGFYGGLFMAIMSVGGLSVFIPTLQMIHPHLVSRFHY